MSKKKCFFYFTLFFSILLCLFSYSSESKALSKPTVVTSNTIIDSKYSFIPRFSSKTTVETFGSGWSVKGSINDTGDYKAIIPRDSQKGKIGVYYRNVGKYKGETMDLKITIEDWDQFYTARGNIAYSDHTIAHMSQGYNFVKQNWEFLNQEGETIPIAMYMTVNDIDSQQTVSFGSVTSSRIKNLYVTKNNWLNISYSDTYSIGYNGDEESTGTDKKAMFTFTYEGNSSLTFYWKKNYAAQNQKKNRVLNTKIVDDKGEYFGFGTYKLAPSDVPELEKYVEETKNPTDGKTVLNMTNYKNEITFELDFTIPGEFEDYYYKSFSLEDYLDTAFIPISSKIIDSNDKDVTSYFDNKDKKGDNLIKYEAKSSVLSESKFYNKQYTLIIKAKLDAAILLDSTNKDKTGYSFLNTGYITKNKEYKQSNEVVVNLKKYKVDVQHISKKTGELIESEKAKYFFAGEKFTTAPKNNLEYTLPEEEWDEVEEGEEKIPKTVPYTPVSNKSKTITVTKNQTLKHYYVLPTAMVGLKKIQIYTAKSSVGLPMKIDFEVTELGDGKADWKSNKVTYTVYQRDKITDEEISENGDVEGEPIFSKTVTVNSLLSTQSITIPSSYLKINQEKNYVVRLDSDNSDDVAFSSTGDQIDTDGYTAKEKKFEINIEKEEKFEKKYVVMTQRYINQNKEYFYEIISIPFKPLEKTKTGYGIDLTRTINYHNDLGDFYKFKGGFRVSPELIDSYLNYGTFEDLKSVTSQEKTYSKISLKDSTQVITTEKVYVEQTTGNLFNEKQKSNKDSRIQYTLLDGGNYLYVPIWLKELGGYDTIFESVEPFAVNQISIVANLPVEVYAYMYAHLDSTTIQDDEILLEPVNLKNPFPEGIPKGWKQSDIDWLKK